MVPSVIGYFMLSCYMDLACSYFQILSTLGEINHFWNKSAFLDGSMWCQVFFAPLCQHVIRDLAGAHFQIFSLLGEINHFWIRSAFFRWLHEVPGVFGSFMSTCYMEPRWFPFSDFKPAWWNKSCLEKKSAFLDGSMWLLVFFGSFTTSYIEPSWFPNFIFSLLG